ncbi:hypothetical protein [Roseomonas sp. WA12]
MTAGYSGEGRLGRRALAPLLLGTLTTPNAPTAAQDARLSGGSALSAEPTPRAVVMPTRMPCADRADDIAGLVVEGTGAPEGTVTVFGQAFAPGDLPSDAGVVARLAGTDRAVPAQLDVTRRHADGSARFGLVSLAMPSLAVGSLIGVVLSRGRVMAGAPLDPAAALRGRSLVVEVASRAGVPWQVDLVEALRGSGATGAWQSGPLVVQARIELPVRAGEVTSLRLVADLSVRADRTMRADLWFRNDVAMRPGGGETGYAARILVDGREVLVADVPRHWQYAAWGRLVGGAEGGREAPEEPRVRQDPAYLARSSAVLPFDLSTGVEEALLARMGQAAADPSWVQPLASRGIETRMGAPGARPDLGQTTAYNAAWVITGDRRAAAYCIGQAEAAGSIPWHFWDPGGEHRGGGWLDVQHWPLFWADARGGLPPRTLLQPFAVDTAWGSGPVPSHQPDLSYVPYVLTGRRAFLDNLMAQAAWNVVTVRSGPRRTVGGSGVIADANMLQQRQVRSAAWSLRQIDEAAWIAPDADRTRAYVEEVAAGNWSWLRAQLPEWTARQGDLHGYIVPLDYGYTPTISPWQQDYFASTAAAATLRGREDARAVLSWMSNFIVGRFFATASGFTRNDGISYTLALFPLPLPRQPAPPSSSPYVTWSEMALQSRERGLANGDGWATSNGEYARLAMLSLALIHHALGDERAREAYTWLAGSGAPYTAPAMFARMPNHNVSLRGLPRLPEQAVSCEAAGIRR